MRKLSGGIEWPMLAGYPSGGCFDIACYEMVWGDDQVFGLLNVGSKGTQSRWVGI